MINTEKVRAMTKLAAYEKNQGKKDLQIVSHFKSEYISRNTFVTGVMVSLALLIIFAVDLGIKFYNNIATLTDFDFVGEGIGYLTIWIFFIVVYSVMSGRLYRMKYEKAKSNIDRYEEHLRELNKYNKE